MPTITGFRATSKIKSGTNGLSNTPATKSHVAIDGTGLANGLTVNVYYPANSQTVLWRGTTSGTNGPQTKCHAKLDYLGTTEPGPRKPRDTDTDVSVTVGGSSPPQPFSVPIGPVLDGSYNVQCNQTGNGNNKWLVPDGTTGVKLTNSNNQAWNFIHLTNAAGNCYQIKIQISDVDYFLAWSNQGNNGTTVALVNFDNGAVTWQLDNNCIKAGPGASGPVYLFMSGNIESGAVSLSADIDPNDSTAWTLNT